MKRVFKYIFCICYTLIYSSNAWAEKNETPLTLDNVIQHAQANSTQAKINNYLFLSSYWEFRSFKAQLLPSINLNAGVANYNRSIIEVRNYENGEVSYVPNNSLSNNVSLSIDQNIAFTGGKISLVSDLSRLDQFDNEIKTLYNSNPIRVSYSQPIRAFNTLKWQKKTAPKQYEAAKKIYLESMQEVTIQATTLFFNTLSAMTEYHNALKKHEDTKTLFDTASEQLKVGELTQSDYLQLELTLLNSEFAVSTLKKSVDKHRFELCLYIGIPYNTELKLFEPNPVKTIIEYNEVLKHAYDNASFSDKNELKLLEAEKDLAMAKSHRGIQLDLNANIGLSQSGNSFESVYKNPKDQEIVGIALRLPIYDWGLSKGGVKMAEARRSITEIDIQEAETRYRYDLFLKVIAFEDSERLCKIMQRAYQIADQRYKIVYDKFRFGATSVNDLNISRQELEAAQKNYIGQLQNFWISYFDIQKITLYDYIRQQNISEDFDRIIEQQGE